MKRNNNAVASIAKKKKISSDEEKGLGKIQSITLRNFMCHDNFELEFGPRMNFIIGQNGSGKSAILTGLILALGSKSSVTGRFSKIQGFIKTGKQGAKVDVVLRNTGEVAYKPELYGNKITVSREFNVNGKNSYKLKSETGKIVSTVKAELTNILNAMDIHVENPVQVLTQETSRTFLLSKHAKGDKLYEFFFKGTCLQALEDSYKSVELEKLDSQKKLENKSQALPGMKMEIDKWKKFLDSSKRIESYKNQLFWAGVIEMEKLVKKKEEDVGKIENEIRINKEEIEKCKVMLDAKTKDLDEFKKKFSDSSSVVSNHKENLHKLNSDFETCKKALMQHERDLAFLAREEMKMSSDMENLENRINENIQKTQTDVKAKESQRLADIEHLQKENQGLMDKQAQLQKQKSDIEEQENSRPKNDNLVAEIQGLEYSRTRTNNDIKRLSLALQNKVNVFGDYTQRILTEISGRRDFKKPPIGPIGMYLEVRDPSWSPAIEKCVTRNLLCSYCVDNHSDDRILKDIFRKYCGNRMPSTIVCPFSDRVHDVSQHKAQTDFPTVLDMLDIKNVQVANALIDQARIENNILIEDTLTGQEYMLNPPRNCYSAYIKNCDQICLNPYRYYSESNPNRNSLLSFIKQDEMNPLKLLLNQLESDIKYKKEQQRQLQVHINSIPLKINELYQEIMRCSRKINNNLDKIKDLDCVKKTEDVYCLKEDLMSLKQDRLNKLSEIENMQQEVTNYKKKKEEISLAQEHQKALVIKEKDGYDALAKQINQCSLAKETLSTGQKRFETELESCTRKLQASLKDLEDAKTKTAIATRNAEKACKRIEVTDDIENIRMRLTETEKVVQEQSNYNRNDIAKKYMEKMKRYKEAKDDLSTLESYLTKLQQMINLRKKTFRDILQHTRTIVDLTFISILSGNGYTGCLKFDDKNKSLKLEVAPKKGQSTRQNHSILSGGERSFVTIAFLLALWERTKMPFRILDEYDVFMDSSNRQLSVDLLIRKAEDMSNTQFIFLSPLDLPHLGREENVKIIVMGPPQRE